MPGREPNAPVHLFHSRSEWSVGSCGVLLQAQGGDAARRAIETFASDDFACRPDARGRVPQAHSHSAGRVEDGAADDVHRHLPLPPETFQRNVPSEAVQHRAEIVIKRVVIGTTRRATARREAALRPNAVQAPSTPRVLSRRRPESPTSTLPVRGALPIPSLTKDAASPNISISDIPAPDSWWPHA